MASNRSPCNERNTLSCGNLSEQRQRLGRNLSIEPEPAVFRDYVEHVFAMRLPREMLRVDTMPRTILRVVVTSVETDPVVACRPCEREPMHEEEFLSDSDLRVSVLAERAGIKPVTIGRDFDP